MANALTLEARSTKLLEVVDCDHEPHQWKSRKGEFSPPKSWEGPGWTTAPGYSTTLSLVERERLRVVHYANHRRTHQIF